VLPISLTILEAVPHAAHVRYYANIVREKWMQRSLIYACTEILSESYDASDDVEGLLQSAERRFVQHSGSHRVTPPVSR
jgi:replicative DNA helicase